MFVLDFYSWCYLYNKAVIVFEKIIEHFEVLRYYFYLQTAKFNNVNNLMTSIVSDLSNIRTF